MRYWNGRSLIWNNGHVCIAAVSKASAVRLAKQAFGDHCFSINELNTYFFECWGTAAKKVLGEQTEEGVWIQYQYHPQFFKFVKHHA